jgi:hypothetical protein
MSVIPRRTNKVAQAGQDLLLRACELQENQRWAHHAVDFAGRIVTRSQDHPVTPLERASQFGLLGYTLSSTLFGGISYQLRPSQPYQAAPLAWIDVWQATYYAPEGDLIWWEPSASFDPRSELLGMSFNMSGLPANTPFLATIFLAGNAFANSTGYAQLQTDEQASGWDTVDVPFDGTFASHTVDMLINYVVPIDASITLQVLAGIQQLEFRAFSFKNAPPTLTQA